MTNKKLNAQEAAEFLGVQSNTLAVWRCQGRGPSYSKIGRRVMYDVEELERFFMIMRVLTTDTAPQLRGRRQHG